MSKPHIYNIRWDVGAHTAFEKRVCDTLWTSINYGMYTTQFFMGNPQNFDRAKISAEDLSSCKKILERYPTNVFTHFPYIANLAGSKKTLAWDGNPLQDYKTTHILRSLEYELGIIAQLGSKKNGVVIHPGNFPDRQKGLETISKSINKINFFPGSKLILENSAGGGTSLATTFLEIKEIINHIDDRRKEHIGVCIDTCHIYAYGDYDLSEVKEVKRMFSDFDKIIGIDKLSLIHLNDSETPIKSRVDRHACIGAGHIWKKNFSSLVYLLDQAQEYGIPIVLETHGLDMITLACL
jgi:deoxyribonuclease-4